MTLSTRQELEDRLDYVIISVSYMYWELLQKDFNQFWHINESLGSSIARMSEGAD